MLYPCSYDSSTTSYSGNFVRTASVSCLRLLIEITAVRLSVKSFKISARTFPMSTAIVVLFRSVIAPRVASSCLASMATERGTGPWNDSISSVHCMRLYTLYTAVGLEPTMSVSFTDGDLGLRPTMSVSFTDGDTLTLPETRKRSHTSHKTALT